MIWRNWSGMVTTTPARVSVPWTTAEVSAIVTAAAESGRRVKAVGSGHSFTSIAAADDIQLRLDQLRGIVSATSDGRLRVGAGTTLRELNALLAERGWALTNLGDINAQTIAGAISTGTHGTGAAFGSLSSQVVGMQLVTGRGDVVEIGDPGHDDGAPSADGPPLAAAAVGLGALGIITEVTLQCVPAFVLHAVEGQDRLGAVLAGLSDRLAEHDHYEFYWFPYTDRCQTKANDRRPGTAQPKAPVRWRKVLDEEVLSNGVFAAANALGAALPRTVPTLNRVAARALSHREYDDLSHRVFITSRRVRFVESEYAVPRDALPAVLTELRSWVDRHPAAAVQFPVEVRVAAADYAWLSTSYNRETAYVAVHQFHRSAFREYFTAFGAIAGAHDGRPHWGKWHDLGATTLTERYPRMADFTAVRQELDPDRVFANDYLNRVLGR